MSTQRLAVASMIYEPNEEIWGKSVRPMLINIVEPIFEIKVKNDNNGPVISKKGQLVGKITEVDKELMKEEDSHPLDCFYTNSRRNGR